MRKNVENHAKIAGFLLLTSFASVPTTFAWDNHQKLMVQITDSPAALSREYLKTKIAIPCVKDEQAEIQKLAVELQINAVKVPAFSQNQNCDRLEQVSARELVQSTFVDEPDLGMDQDLPNSADPQNFRAWMGGKTGPTSQGFRHMYFGGVEWLHPLDTFQIPLHAVGQAPDRFEKLRLVSERYFKEGNLFWGTRTLLWSIHILQDLHQPFHVTQVPAMKMVPWKNLFSGFVARSTQVLGNEHYAYEGLALAYVNDAAVSDFKLCFEVKDMIPVDHILTVVQETRTVSPKLGQALLHLFGNQMKDPKMDLPRQEGEIDYYAFTHSSTNTEEGLEQVHGLKEVREITCDLMKQVSAHTWAELDRAFHYTSISINNGK